MKAPTLRCHSDPSGVYTLSGVMVRRGRLPYPTHEPHRRGSIGWGIWWANPSGPPLGGEGVDPQRRGPPLGLTGVKKSSVKSCRKLIEGLFRMVENKGLCQSPLNGNATPHSAPLTFAWHRSYHFSENMYTTASLVCPDGWNSQNPDVSFPLMPFPSTDIP